MAVAVVNSGGANISSVLHALKRLGTEPEFTADAGVIRAADRVIMIFIIYVFRFLPV